MSFEAFLQSLGEPISDHEEETFLLFTTVIPSSNLGFVDSTAPDLEVEINGEDLTIKQSPGLLHSNLTGGTTGAVVWKVTPAFARWLSNPSNVLFRDSFLGSESIILELGTGTSGLVALAVGAQVRKYIATDQEYVLKILSSNITCNTPISKKAKASGHDIQVLALDWETSDTTQLPFLIPELRSSTLKPGGLDAVVACDCIYNEVLISSFVETCASLCDLRRALREPSTIVHDQQPTICIVAQQLRSNIVFEEWLRIFNQKFQVWRMPDELLNMELKEGNGFVVHIGILR